MGVLRKGPVGVVEGEVVVLWRVLLPGLLNKAKSSHPRKKVCLPCLHKHEVRVRLHPAYTSADPECGKCVDAVQLKLRFPDANLDDFDTIEFQDSLSEELGLEY